MLQLYCKSRLPCSTASNSMHITNFGWHKPCCCKLTYIKCSLFFFILHTFLHGFQGWGHVSQSVYAGICVIWLVSTKWHEYFVPKYEQQSKWEAFLISFKCVSIYLFCYLNYTQLYGYTLKNKGASRCHRRTFLSKWFHKEPLTSEEPFCFPKGSLWRKKVLQIIKR